MSQSTNQAQNVAKKPAQINHALMSIGTLIFLTFIFSACVKKAKSETYYFNVDSLILEQIKFFSKVPVSLTRESQLGYKVVTKIIPALDSVGWATELEEFSQLTAINKPTYKGSFAIESGLEDTKSNLKVRAFINTKGLPIEYFKIYYQDRPFKLRKIQAFIRESNSLYKSSRTLAMEFQDLYNKTVLTSYSIKGGQKMIAGDSIEFEVRGKIRID